MSSKILDVAPLLKFKPSASPYSAWPFALALSDLAHAGPTLAADVCQHLGDYQATLTRLLHSQGKVPPGTRVWLRPDTALVRYSNLHAAHVGATSQGPHLALLSGIVQSATAPTQHIYSRCLICPSCEQQHTALSGGTDVVQCECGMQGGVGEWAEDLAGRVMMPVRCVWLTELHTAAVPGDRAYSTRPQLPVEVVLSDDLCINPAVRIGAPLAVVGWITVTPHSSAGAGSQLTAGMTVTAFNVRPTMVYGPWLRHPTASPHQPASLGQQALLLAAGQPLLHGRPIHTCSPYNSLYHQRITSTAGLSATDSTDPPLHSLANAVMDACGTYIAPTLCLGLLVSAAAAPCAMRALQLGVWGPESVTAPTAAAPAMSSGVGSVDLSSSAMASHTGVSVLLLHEPHDPVAARVLRSAASLLCPVSTAPTGPGQIADMLLPRLERVKSWTDTTTGEEAQLLQGSLLTSANAGVTVLDAAFLCPTGNTGLANGSKHRCAALTTVLSGAGVLRLGASRAAGTAATTTTATEHLVPATSTVWCSAPARHLGGGALDDYPGGRDADLLAGVDAGFPADRFDLVLRMVCDEDTAALCVLEAGCDTRSPPGCQEVAKIQHTLQHHMAVAAQLSDVPLLTPAAQHLLSAYFVSVRSTSRGALRSKDILRTLVTCAGNCARLLLRNQVLPYPDCTVAVVLMEETLANRHLCDVNLDLPALSYDLPIDEQLFEIHQRLTDQLRAYGTPATRSLLEDSADGPLLVLRPTTKSQGPSSGCHEP